MSDGTHHPRGERSKSKTRTPSGAQFRLNACVKNLRMKVLSVDFTTDAGYAPPKCRSAAASRSFDPISFTMKFQRKKSWSS